MNLRGRALLATAFLAVSACSGPSASSTQSTGGSALATATATAEATNASTSASASSTSSDQPPAFENLSLATVLVNGLAVRTAAGLSSALLQRRSMPGGAMEDVRLNEGNHVYVLSSGPSQPVDGQWWFQVAVDANPAFGVDGAVDVGWVAVGTAADPWIREDNGFCDARPTFATLAAVSRIVRIGCYGSAPLTIDAYQTTVPPGAGLGGACEKLSNPLRWLLCDNINYSYVNAAGGESFQFLLHFDPARGIAPTVLAEGTVGAHWRIVGHFDDPAAEGCASDARTSNEGQAEWLMCATDFVVESITPLG